MCTGGYKHPEAGRDEDYVKRQKKPLGRSDEAAS
jgi:hypothetical protein